MTKGSKPQTFLTKIQHAINNSFEFYFFSHGKTVATHPVKVIFACSIFTIICGLGFLNFQKESNPNKLWIKETSDFLKVYDWKQENYPPSIRRNIILFEADNILKKENLLAMFAAQSHIKTIRTKERSSDDVCLKMPSSSSTWPFGRRRRSIEKKLVSKRQADWFNIFNVKTDYCTLLESLEKICYFESVLEVWQDVYELRGKSQKEIYEDVTNANRSAVFGRSLDVNTYLSGIVMNGSQIVGAKSALYAFANGIDMEAVKRGDIYKDDLGLDYTIDSEGHKWEGKFIEEMDKYVVEHDNIGIYFMTQSSLNRVSDQTIFGDASYFVFGFLIEFIYVTIMLGKFNSVEQRPVLAAFGLLCIGFSIIVSYGICSAIGVKYSPFCTVLPFLLLGLGIDGMFVIVQAWNNLSYVEKKADLETRMGFALKHAGVSITIASTTNFMAFIIGCASVLPGIFSFCLYTAVGILCVFILQCTFFTAWFTLDQRRLEKKKHCLFWCYKKKNWEPNECSKRDLCQMFFKDVIGKLLVLKPIKAFVILLCLTIFGLCVWSSTFLRQELNLMWFAPPDHHLYRFYVKTQKHFSDNGYEAEILFGETDYQNELPKILKLSENLRNNKYVGKVRSWADEFKLFIDERGFDVLDPHLDSEQFNTELIEFFYSEKGVYFRENDFKFNGTLNCMGKLPRIIASRIEFNYRLLHNTYERLNAMHTVRGDVANMNFNSYAKASSNMYFIWEADEIIMYELCRNLALAMIIVFCITLVLMASWRASFLVLLCVVFSMIDLIGIMQLWGITVEATSATTLVLAVGLCVDYSAHVGHTFMTQQGTKDERLTLTLANIGPAVFNGGVSTFLAFIFLADSTSYIFTTFFRCFFTVTLLGLFHGLIFLPVVLSLVGPEAHVETHPEDKETEKLYYEQNGNKLEKVEDSVTNNPSSV